MSRRPYMARFQCGEPGCREFANYESSTRTEQTELLRKYANGKWRCTRHDKPEQVLSVASPVKVTEHVVAEGFYEGRSIGLYFGSQGFIFGPGFRVWAKDFPAGTTIRVTAEVIPPNTPTPAGQTGRDPFAAQTVNAGLRDEPLKLPNPQAKEETQP